MLSNLFPTFTITNGAVLPANSSLSLSSDSITPIYCGVTREWLFSLKLLCIECEGSLFLWNFLKMCGKSRWDRKRVEAGWIHLLLCAFIRLGCTKVSCAYELWRLTPASFVFLTICQSDLEIVRLRSAILHHHSARTRDQFIESHKFVYERGGLAYNKYPMGRINWKV